MSSIECCHILSDLTDPAIRQDIFRTELHADPRLRFEARVKALNGAETTELFKALLATVASTDSPGRSTDVRNAAVGVLSMLNFASMDQGEITNEYITAVDTLTGQMDTISEPTERGREMLDIGETLSPHFLRTEDNITRLTTSCNELAERIPYEYYYENPYQLAKSIVEGKPKSKGIDRSTDRTRIRIIAALASDPARIWTRKEFADKIGITPNTLNGQLSILHVSLSQKWRRVNKK